MNHQNYIVDENTCYHSYRTPECNLTNPITYFEGTMQEQHYQFAMGSVRMHPSYNQLSTRGRLELSQRFKWKAKQDWKNEYNNLIDYVLPVNLKLLLAEPKKKAQQKLIKGLTLDTDMLLSLSIQAWKTFKLPYSRFMFEYQAKEFAGRVYPAMMYLKDDGEFDYVGITDLSPSEMKVAIQKKHRVICDFIGTVEHWHCFFRTEAGIRGTEAPHIGEPHIHYISSAWGLSRDKVIENLSSYRYSLKADTITFKPR